MDSSNSSHYLSNRGYVITKKDLSTEEIQNIKNELTVTPFTIDGYGSSDEVSFKTYMESSGKLYLPKYYALQRFGVPQLSKIKDGEDISIAFQGSLRPLQEDAASTVLDACRDPSKMGGLLCLRCGEGKTITAIYMICILAKKTLIVVHKDFLLEQWKERIMEFAPNAKIGLIKAKIIDIEDKDIVIASIQSLSMKEYDPSLFESFGTLVIDECHHMGSQVFSQALKKINFRYSIGLTATPKRKDGLTKVFIWFIGDIAYVSAKRRDTLEVHFKEFYDNNPVYSKEHLLFNKKPNMAKMINNICEYIPRVTFLVEELKKYLNIEPNRKVLILSDRRQHLHILKEELDKTVYTSGFYYGGMSSQNLKESEGKQILLATYQYASEGFDMKGLDTLILASPKSDVIQVVGRILRDKPEDRKHTPLVIDIVDTFSMFLGQGKKRQRYYKSCKYSLYGTELFLPIKTISLDKGICIL